MSDSLLRRYLDAETLTEAEVSELRGWLLDDRSRLRSLAETVRVESELRRMFAGDVTTRTGGRADVQPNAGVCAGALRFPSRRLLPAVAAVALLALGATLALLVGRFSSGGADDPTIRIAALSGPPDTPLDSAATTLTIGASITIDDPLSLPAGVSASVRFDDGTRGRLSGPATLTVRSGRRIALDAGSLFLDVPGSSAGWLVDTPAATFADIGTAFTVEADPTGSARVGVHEGAVAVLRPGEARRAGARATINAGEQAIVTSPTAPVAVGALQRSTLAAIELQLTDILLGGDGLGGRTDGGIDTSTGRVTERRLPAYVPPGVARPFVPARGVPFVEGISTVMPNSSIRYTGDGRIAALGGLASGTSHVDLIRAGGPVHGNNEPGSGGIMPDTVGATNFSRLPGSYLFLHASLAVTFDVAALGRHHDAVPGRFTALIANAEQSRRTRVAEREHTTFTVHAAVLIDGRPVFVRRSLSRDDGPVLVDVPIDRSARYLTLYIGDGGDDQTCDWGLIGAPILHMTPRPTTQ